MKLETVKSYITIFSLLFGILVGAYAFVPKVLSDLGPIERTQVEQMLKKHESFVSNGNIDGMMSLYHPEFSMDVIYAGGRSESFNRSQVVKHLETMQLMVSTSLDNIAEQISVLNSDDALVSIVMKQETKLNGLPVSDNAFVYQSMLVTMHERQPKILKVLSTSHGE